jgi:hypothetical protein
MLMCVTFCRCTLRVSPLSLESVKDESFLVLLCGMRSGKGASGHLLWLLFFRRKCSVCYRVEPRPPSQKYRARRLWWEKLGPEWHVPLMHLSETQTHSCQPRSRRCAGGRREGHSHQHRGQGRLGDCVGLDAVAQDTDLSRVGGQGTVPLGKWPLCRQQTQSPPAKGLSLHRRPFSSLS